MPFSAPVFRPDLQNPYPISEEAEIMSSLLRLEGRQKKFFKSIQNSHISFLTHLELKPDKYVHTLLSRSFSRKPYPITDQNGQNLYLFSGQKRAKTLSDEAAHTYIAFIAVQSYPVNHSFVVTPGYNVE